MHVVRTLVLALALSMVGPTLLAGDALAADVFGPEGAIRLVPAAPIVADGSVVDLYVVARNPDGSAMTGMSLKVTASAGTAEAWDEVGDGIYRIPFQTAGITTASDVTLTARGKSPTTRRAVTLIETVRVVPGHSGVPLEATPSELTLGRDTEASLAIEGVGKGGVASALSTGALENVTAMGGGGAYVARFVAPAVNFPQNAIITVADAADPFAHRSHIVMKLDGSVDFPVKGAPGASVLLEIGDQKFGPTLLGEDGRGKVAIQVPPGVQRATQVTIVDGHETREELDLRIPETRRLQLFPLPETLPADGAVEVPVRVAIVKPDGSPDPDARPEFTASGGTVAEAEHLGDGVFEAEWTLPTTPGAATIEVTLGTDLQTDSAEVALIQRRPISAKLAARPSTIEAGTAVVEVTTVATDAGGAPLTGASLGYALEGGEPAGSVAAGEDGSYTLPVQPTGSGALHAQTWLVTETSRNPVRGVVLVPERGPVENDPSAPVDVLVVAVDAFGLPVADAKVALSVSSGGGTLASASVTTGDDGTARVAYTPGRDPGLAALEGAAGGYVGTVAFLQLPEGVPGVEVPASGGAREVAWTRAWTASSPSIEVTRAPGAKSPPPTPSASSAVAHTDDVTEAPAASGEDGAIEGAEVVAGTEEPSPWTLPAAEPEPAPADTVASEPARVPRAKPAAGDFRWLRARGSVVGSTYRYEQVPSAENGPLIPSRLAVGGPDGGAPAVPVGVELDARAWGDDLGVPYVGAHAMFRAAGYSIAADAFDNAADDALLNLELDVLGRYPLELAGDRYWVGAKLGFHYNDFLIFRGCLDPGCEVQFDTVPVPGLALGAELGAEVGPMYLVGGYTLGLARGIDPYSNGVDVNVGYQILPNVFADLGFGVLTRTVVLEGADSGLERGSLADSQMIGKLGVGFSL